MTSTNLSRRRVLTAGAWSVPVVALAVATPTAAASTTTPELDLSTVAALPNEARDGVNNGTSYYHGPRDLTFTFTYSNSGPAALPAGGVIAIDLPFPAVWEDPKISNSGGRAITRASGLDRSYEVTTEGNPVMFRRAYYFTLDEPVAAGATFKVTYRVRLTGTENTATNFYRARFRSEIGVGSTGAVDTNAGNDVNTYSEYVRINAKDLI